MKSHAAEIAQPEPTFEQMMARLEAIAGTLEGDQVPLEEALRLFEEGIALSKAGTQRLDAAERRLEVLLDQGHTAPLVLPAEADMAGGAHAKT